MVRTGAYATVALGFGAHLRPVGTLSLWLVRIPGHGHWEMRDCPI